MMKKKVDRFPEMSTPAAKKTITIQDVADAAGVGKATVSKVFNEKGRISPLTIELVRHTAERLNFEPNLHAQRLSRGHRSKTIALCCFQLDLGVSARKVHVIQGLLAEKGYEIPAYSLSYGPTAQLHQQAEGIVNNVRRQRPRAILSTRMPPGAFRELQRYREEGGLVVFYDTPTDMDCDKVVFDRENSTYLATRHLLELGHRSIGFCAPGGPVQEGAYLDGFRRALGERGLKAKSEWLFGSDIYGFGGGFYEEAGAQMAEKFLKLKKRPSAMCITDDYSAVAFAAAITTAGLKVPQDVSVVGHDDSPIARYGTLKLSSVTHPVEAIAEHVVRLVTSRIEGDYEGASREINVSGQLIVRDSTTAFG